MASFMFHLEGNLEKKVPKIVDRSDHNDYVAEGVEAMVPYKGSVVEDN